MAPKDDRGLHYEDPRKTAEWIGLKIGSQIEFKVPKKEYAGEISWARRTGRVIAIYDHYFTCKMDKGWVESFRHNQLINHETGGQKIKLRG